MVNFQCDACSGLLTVEDDSFGASIVCGNCHRTTSVPESLVSPRAILGDFLMVNTLGNGGMGTVYLAHQVSLDREVALKVLHPHFSRDTSFVTDFVNEARNAAKLNHPNVVQALAVGNVGQHFYIAMELVRGESVQDIMEEDGLLDPKFALGIIRDVAVALDYGWRMMHLVHRDIKPDNVMIREDGKVKLADLGLARPLHELDEDEDEIQATPQYMCPETLLGEPMDIRGDIYSLGATLFHLVTGRFPFEGTNGMEIAQKHVDEALDYPGEVNANVPDPISDLIVKMMAKSPEERHVDPAALIVAIDQCKKDMVRKKKRAKKVQAIRSESKRVEQEVAQGNQAIKRRNRMVAILAVVAIVGAGIGASFLSSNADPYSIPAPPKRPDLPGKVVEKPVPPEPNVVVEEPVEEPVAAPDQTEVPPEVPYPTVAEGWNFKRNGKRFDGPTQMVEFVNRAGVRDVQVGLKFPRKSAQRLHSARPFESFEDILNSEGISSARQLQLKRQCGLEPLVAD